MNQLNSVQETYYKLGMSVEEILAEWDYLRNQPKCLVPWLSTAIIEPRLMGFGTKIAPQ